MITRRVKNLEESSELSSQEQAEKGGKYERYALKNRSRVFSIIVICSLLLLCFFLELEIKEPDEVSGAVSQFKYSVVLNTFKRYELMTAAIEHYSNCPNVNSIHVVWSEQDPPPDAITELFKTKSNPKIYFEEHPTTSLNNRFIPLQNAHEDGVFAVDDDMRVPCGELEFAFQVWLSSQRAIVGFMPRIHIRGSQGKLIYRCWWRVWWYGKYSIILTKAAFLHHDYFNLYSTPKTAAVRNFVDKRRNCEDIAMQFVVANSTHLPPIFVKGHLRDLGVFNGISTDKDVVKAAHMDERSECLNGLVEIFGHNPLVKSKVVVDSAVNRWSNSPSTWFEYISSDLWNFDSFA